MPPLLDDRPRLTAEERAALSIAADGRDEYGVATVMRLAPARVRGLLASAVRKLGARSKLEAVLLADRMGLLDPRP
jgi:DNA-binding CsgD family transcriptional regulator